MTTVLIASKASIGIILAFLLSGCFWFDENNQYFLVGRYLTETSVDTRTALYFDDSARTAIEPLVQNVSAIGVTPTYLAVRDEARCYSFVRTMATDATVIKTAIGLMDLHTFHSKLAVSAYWRFNFTALVITLNS